MSKVLALKSPSPSPSPSAARSQLAEAISQKSSAQKQHDKAARALDRAGVLLTEAKEKLAAFDNLDAEIARYHAAAIKAATAGQQVPERLQRQKTERAEAREAVVMAKGARDVLAGELDEAKVALVDAEVVVAQNAERVMIEDAMPLIAALQEAREATWRCTDQLKGLAGVWVAIDKGPRLVKLPHEVIEILHAQRPQRAVCDPAPETVEMGHWRDYFRSLCQDATARLDGVQSRLKADAA